MNITVKENARIGEKYYYMKHRSGLDIYVIPKKLTSAYALFCTRYGAVDNCFKLAGEEEFTRVPDGIAHYLELRRIRRKRKRFHIHERNGLPFQMHGKLR